MLMTPEERLERIERQMEFLAQSQTQTSGQLFQLSQRVEQLGDYLLRTARFMEDFARRTEERFGQVAEWQRRSDESIERLAAAQQRTDERLNILIAVVERYFSNGKRG